MECGRPRFDPWVGKISWRRKWQPTPVFVPGKSHGQRSWVGCHPWGREEADKTERFHSHFDHELLIAKFRFKLKKAGKTTRPFRYDLNQIPYDYTVEVRNRFKGLDLIECLLNYRQRFVTLYSRQGSRASTWKRNAKRQNGCLRRPYK